MNRVKYLYYYLYSFIFCLRYLPFSQAKKIPILIHPSTKVRKLSRGGIIIKGKIWDAMIVIGFEGTIGRCNNDTLIYINDGCHIYFNGYAFIAKGCQLIINKGDIVFGKNLTFNGDCTFSCYHGIQFGNDIICGWNVSFLTTNGHSIVIDGIEKEKEAPIVIGNHVWIGADCVINKGVVIPNGCVCAHHSVVTTSIEEENCLYGGFPAKLLKKNVSWKP